MDQAASSDEHKRIVRRVYEEFTNQRQLDLAEVLFGADFVDHGAPATRRGGVRFLETCRRPQVEVTAATGIPALRQR